MIEEESGNKVDREVALGKVGSEGSGSYGRRVALAGLELVAAVSDSCSGVLMSQRGWSDGVRLNQSCRASLIGVSMRAWC